MKLIVFLAGLILSTWVTFTVYQPLHVFFEGVNEVYRSSQTVIRKTGQTLDSITSSSAYQEISRIFGKEATKEAILANSDNKNVIEKLFEHDLALWSSVIIGFFTFSIYLNILTFIAFFFKPVTFLMKK